MFGKSNVARFVTELEESLEKVKDNIVKDLKEELEPKIQDDAWRMIPYDTGRAADSYYSSVEIENGDIVLYVGFDKEGRLRDYLPMIHELVPAEWNPDYADYYKPKSHYRSDHDPQIKFLERAMWNNWQQYGKDLKVKFK